MGSGCYNNVGREMRSRKTILNLVFDIAVAAILD